MHYSSALFGEEYYMFQTDLLLIIRSLNTVIHSNRYLSY